VAQDYLPEQLKHRQLYFPTKRGFEKVISERLDYWRRLKARQKNGDEEP
jgi:putative ATPase